MLRLSLLRLRSLRRPRIRPYPQHLEKPWRFEDSLEVLIRPIRPEDEAMLARFHATLSERSVYLRYFHMLPLDARVDHKRLSRICFIDYDREMVLVAERDQEILAVGRLVRAENEKEAEFAVLISDQFQGHGLGTELLKRLIEIARADGLERVTADMLGENRQMIEICKLLGFHLEYSGENVVKAELDLNALF
jgi:acetyltransferase